MQIIAILIFCLKNPALDLNHTEALPGVGGGTHVSCLDFKTSRVGVYKFFTSLLEIEWKFFVFVTILEKGDNNVW